MQHVLSRKDRQLEKMELAASKGLNCVVLQLYSNEATRWAKKGFKVTKNDNDNKKIGMYTLTFNFSSLLNSAEIYRYVISKATLPSNFNYAQKLYIKSQKAIFEQSFID